MKNPSQIKNKAKRTEVYAKYKLQKKKIKKKLREERVKEVESLGEKAPPKQVPKTIDNSRAVDDTFVMANDEEVLLDEQDDEFCKYFNNEKKPKIMITTRPKCSSKLFTFIGELMQMIPNAFYYPRKNLTVTDMTKYANDNGFTHVVVMSEKYKKCDGMLITHLPIGPTAFFRISSFQSGSDIRGHGNPTSHVPELIMNNFVTRTKF